MACSCAGMLAQLVLFAAATLNIVAFVLPLWTTSLVVSGSLADELTSVDFAAGLWGFCTASANEPLTFDHCYFFHISSQYERTGTDDTFMSNFSDYSVCGGYKESPVEYTNELAHVVSMNSTSLGKFLDKSCGALGTASFTLGAISTLIGVLAVIFLTLGITCGITCCRRRAVFDGVGRLLALLGFFTTLVTVSLWLPQSHVLGDEDDVTLNGSFIISVIAAALFLVSLCLVARHEATRKYRYK